MTGKASKQASLRNWFTTGREKVPPSQNPVGKGLALSSVEQQTSKSRSVQSSQATVETTSSSGDTRIEGSQPSQTVPATTTLRFRKSPTCSPQKDGKFASPPINAAATKLPSHSTCEDRPRTPTRTLFASQNVTDTGKRTAHMAQLSPQKAKPPAKMIKTSPMSSSRSSSGTPRSADTPPLASPSVGPAQDVKRSFEVSMEIKGSDDEDDDSVSSDCSLPDIDTLIPTKSKVREPPRPKTPPGNIRRRGPLRPLVPSTTKHKFDIKTLLDHQRRDDTINANFKQLETAEEEEEEAQDVNAVIDNEASMASPNTIRQQFIDISGVQDETAGKALRAMERTQIAKADKCRWYFFRPDFDTNKSIAQPFPKSVAKGPWKLLAKDGTRTSHVSNGSLSIWASHTNLPDDIFLWVLHHITHEKSFVARRQYCQLISNAQARQIRRLVTPQLLLKIFEGIGASQDLGHEKLRPVQETEDIYTGRNWSVLLVYLDLIGGIAHHITSGARIRAAICLLRMAMDKALMEDPNLLRTHQRTLSSLVGSVDPSSWDIFCQTVCASMYASTEKNSLQTVSLLCISGSTYKLRELRRRLAMNIVLGQPSHAKEHSDHAAILSDAISRLQHENFDIRRKTDYVELKAQIQLLDFAIDDGSLAIDLGDLDAELSFNNHIDEISSRLRNIWSSINDAGALYLARTEAKSAIDSLQKRLAYSERTRALPKQSIFDMPGTRREVVSQGQRDFMHKFVGNLRKPREGTRTDVGFG